MDPLGTRLVRAIAEHDETALGACFASDAQFRALTPSGLRERSGAAETASLVSTWFGDSTELDLLDSHSEEIGDRVRISYRFAGVEEGDPYVVEQILYCTVSENRIVHADLLCSGFRPRSAK